MSEGVGAQPGPRHLLLAPGEHTGSGRALLPSLAEDLAQGDLAGARAKLKRLSALLREQSAALKGPS